MVANQRVVGPNVYNGRSNTNKSISLFLQNYIVLLDQLTRGILQNVPIRL